MRLDAALESATERLSVGSESPRLDAELLLCQSIDVARSYLYAHPDDELDSAAFDRFDALLSRRETGEPLAYIAGTREFWSQELLVTPATLVPRPETELLVELALRRIPADVEWGVLDLGTGSGAIALAVASERPLCRITATDRSAAALRVARENARQMNIANIEFQEGDWLEPVREQCFEIILSNPPYVCDGDPALAALQYEPQSALVAGADGLRDLRVLAAESAAQLRAGGWLLLEHGAEQEDSVRSVLLQNGWSEIANHLDLAGRPRVTEARKSDT